MLTKCLPGLIVLGFSSMLLASLLPPGADIFPWVGLLGERCWLLAGADVP